MSNNVKVKELREVEDIHAIILGDGDEWHNQCGGYACHQRYAHGTLHKLDGDEIILSDFFTGEKYSGWCDDGIDAETASYIEAIVPDFKVDRDKFDESCEAWIHGFVNGKAAILVWGNSD